MKAIVISTIIFFKVSLCLTAQIGTHDMAIVDRNTPEKTRVMKSLEDSNNVIAIESTKPGAYIIGAMLENKSINDLHVYVETRPGVLVFDSGELNVHNIQDNASFLKTWGESIKGKVFIHSNKVFTGAEGIMLKTQLEQLTGLLFEMR